MEQTTVVGMKYFEFYSKYHEDYFVPDEWVELLDDFITLTYIFGSPQWLQIVQ